MHILKPGAAPERIKQHPAQQHDLQQWRDNDRNTRHYRDHTDRPLRQGAYRLPQLGLIIQPLKADGDDRKYIGKDEHHRGGDG